MVMVMMYHTLAVLWSLATMYSTLKELLWLTVCHPLLVGNLSTLPAFYGDAACWQLLGCPDALYSWLYCQDDPSSS